MDVLKKIGIDLSLSLAGHGLSGILCKRGKPYGTTTFYVSFLVHVPPWVAQPISFSLGDLPPVFRVERKHIFDHSINDCCQFQLRKNIISDVCRRLWSRYHMWHRDWNMSLLMTLSEFCQQRSKKNVHEKFDKGMVQCFFWECSGSATWVAWRFSFGIVILFGTIVEFSKKKKDMIAAERLHH